MQHHFLAHFLYDETIYLIHQRLLIIFGYGDPPAISLETLLFHDPEFENSFLWYMIMLLGRVDQIIKASLDEQGNTKINK